MCVCEHMYLCWMNRKTAASWKGPYAKENERPRDRSGWRLLFSLVRASLLLVITPNKQSTDPLVCNKFRTLERCFVFLGVFKKCARVKELQTVMNLIANVLTSRENCLSYQPNQTIVCSYAGKQYSLSWILDSSSP